MWWLVNIHISSVTTAFNVDTNLSDGTEFPTTVKYLFAMKVNAGMHVLFWLQNSSGFLATLAGSNII